MKLKKYLSVAERKELGDLLWLLKYETYEGISTWHECPCGRRGTRRGQCSECLIEDIYKVRGGKPELNRRIAAGQIVL